MSGARLLLTIAPVPRIKRTHGTVPVPRGCCRPGPKTWPTRTTDMALVRYIWGLPTRTQGHLQQEKGQVPQVRCRREPIEPETR